MTAGQEGIERVMLSRSVIRQMQREARARGYARGRVDERRDALRRLERRPVGEAEFVHEAMARPGEPFGLVWNVLQAAPRTETGGEPR